MAAGRTPAGAALIQLRAVDGTVWLTQLELAHLFETSKQNISLHVRKILAEGELREDAVVKFDLTTAADGKHYKTQLYSLALILAVGFRVSQTDRFLAFNERSVLTGAGRISHEWMEAVIGEHFASFDARRRSEEALAAEQEADEELRQIQAEASRLRPAGKAKDSP